MMHSKLMLTYKNNIPYGIRDENGYLFMFPEITKFQNQEKRYENEIKELFDLANDLLGFLEKRTFCASDYDGNSF